MKPLRALILLIVLGLVAACGPQNSLPPATVTVPAEVAPIPVEASPTAWVTLPVEGCPPFAFETTLPENPDVAESYLGHHYDDLNMPNGLEFRGAAMIDDIHAWVNVWRPTHQMYWLEKFLCRDANGRAYFEIVAAIDAPLEQDTYTGSNAGCVDANGRAVDVFVAYGKYDPDATLSPDDKRALSDLDFAIRLDLANEKFVSIPVTGLTCFRSAGGLGGP